MYGVLVLCMGYLSYVWDSLMFWYKAKSHVTRVQLWRSVLSYVWDICLMYGILVLRLGYLSYVLEKIKITCHPGATMAECIVLCMGY